MALRASIPASVFGMPRFSSVADAAFSVIIALVSSERLRAGMKTKIVGSPG